jgi:hypothetical protein
MLLLLLSVFAVANAVQQVTVAWRQELLEWVHACPQ